eukprot:Awhi_evm1s2440
MSYEMIITILLSAILLNCSSAAFCKKDFTLKIPSNFKKVFTIDDHLNKEDKAHMGTQLGPYPIYKRKGVAGRGQMVEEYHPTFAPSRFSIAEGSDLDCDVLRLEQHVSDGDGA